MDDYIRTIVDDEINEYIQVSERLRSRPLKNEAEFPMNSLLALFEFVYSKRDLYKFMFSADVPSSYI